MVIEWLLKYWDLLLTGVSVALSVAFIVIYNVKRFRALRNAKTSEERDAILSELRSNAYGLVAVAEQMFADIPKSGASKLLYVLNHIEKLCTEKSIEFNESNWTEFINGIVGASNDVKTAKETEKAISGYITKVKEEVPYFLADADKLFEVIPDSAAYKLEYILKLISNACAKYAINVFDLYDWRTYVEELYNEKIGA